MSAARGSRSAAKPDPLNPEQRSRNMSRIRARDTKPELLLRRALHAAGVRYRLHDRSLPGTPDLVLAGRRAVIFVHGCFWHAHDCPFGVIPVSNRAFWEEKFARNEARDVEQLRLLREAGWRTGVVWECALKGPARHDLNAVVARTADWLRRADVVMEIGGRWDEVAQGCATPASRCNRERG